MLLSIDRSNHMINPMLSADTTAEITANFAENITENSVLCSDGSWPYLLIDKVYYIQTVNGETAHFKGWING